jgi:hypothetical protein
MIRMTMAPSIRMLALITTLALGVSPKDAGAQNRACGSEVQAIEVNEATLHYLECGQGEPIVFVHGTLGDLNVFRTQAQTFEGRSRPMRQSGSWGTQVSGARIAFRSCSFGHADDGSTLTLWKFDSAKWPVLDG